MFSFNFSSVLSRVVSYKQKLCNVNSVLAANMCVCVCVCRSLQKRKRKKLEKVRNFYFTVLVNTMKSFIHFCTMKKKFFLRYLLQEEFLKIWGNFKNIHYVGKIKLKINYFFLIL